MPHKLSNTLACFNGLKATAVTMGCIQSRKVIQDTVMYLTSYVCFLYTLEKRSGIWLIRSMSCIYEKDGLIPAGFEPMIGLSLPPH